MNNLIKKYKADKKGAYFAEWQTPLSNAESVYLMSILHAPAYTFFFFLTRHGRDGNKEKLHSMRITRGYAFRVFDEYCTRPIAEYISSKKENISFRTCKVWNSPFLKEMDFTGELSGIGEKKNNDLFMHVIMARDEWIEFFSYYDTPVWKTYTYRGRNVDKNEHKKLIKKYVEKYF